MQEEDIPKPSQIDFKLNQNLQEELPKVLTDLLKEHKDIFASKLKGLGKNHLLKHLINTGIAASVRQGPYRVSPKQREIINEELQQMIDHNIVQRSTSSWDLGITCNTYSKI